MLYSGLILKSKEIEDPKGWAVQREGSFRGEHVFQTEGDSHTAQLTCEAAAAEQRTDPAELRLGCVEVTRPLDDEDAQRHEGRGGAHVQQEGRRHHHPAVPAVRGRRVHRCMSGGSHRCPMMSKIHIALSWNSQQRHESHRSQAAWSSLG